MKPNPDGAGASAEDRQPLAYVVLTPSSIALNPLFWDAFDAVAPDDKTKRAHVWRDVVKIIDSHVEAEKSLLQTQCRILHEELTQLRQRCDEMERQLGAAQVAAAPVESGPVVEDESPLSMLEQRFKAQMPTRQSFQNQVHQYFVERIGGSDTLDTVGSSRRLLRAAMLLANETAIPVASMVEVWRSLPCRKTDRAKMLGECLIALNGLATTIKYDLAETGKAQLDYLVQNRQLPLNYSESDLFFIPF